MQKFEQMWMHPFNDEGAKARLLNDYKKHGGLVVGLDFDNTIYDYNQTGADMSSVIDLVKRAQALNFPICLYTAETDVNKLAWKYNYLKDLGINLLYINQSPLMKGTQKPFFNILLDDRAGLESACETLLYVIEYAENQSH